MARCTFDKGFLHHSYIATDGIDVYRCTAEDSFNEAGRYFITTAAGAIEVLPKKHGRGWSYEFVDVEDRRQKEETLRIQEELDARQKLFRSNQQEIAKRLERQDEDED